MRAPHVRPTAGGLTRTHSHATGFFGRTGRGTDEYHGVQGRVDIINSTLGKALGGATGGYTAGPRRVVEVLRQRSRPYLFSNSVAPAVVAASLAVFDLLEKDHSLVAKLQRNTHAFRDGMAKAGFKLSGQRDCPIVPVMLGDARLAGEMADDLLGKGVYVIGFSFPVVPKGAARIRCQMSAAVRSHSVARARVGVGVVVGELTRRGRGTTSIRPSRFSTASRLLSRPARRGAFSSKSTRMRAHTQSERREVTATAWRATCWRRRSSS